MDFDFQTQSASGAQAVEEHGRLFEFKNPLLDLKESSGPTI